MSTCPPLSRRAFTKLTMAAFAGLSVGVRGKSTFGSQQANQVNPLLSEPHICRGLNTCKEKGADRKNKCAGMGVCATARYHTCHGHNDCRGQGGCGDIPGENQCGGMGSCDVPLRPVVWQNARRRFEQLMKYYRRKVGPAPRPPVQITSG
jgi:hypothetical protein